MTCNCEMALTVSGKFKQIRRFVKYLLHFNLQDEDNLLSKFKIIRLEANFWVLTLSIQSIPWCDEVDKLWKTIRYEAEKAGLTYISNKKI